MGKTRAECSQNAYTSAFLGHWIQILANSSPKSDNKKKKKKKKNPTLFFRILRSVGRGQHNKKKFLALYCTCITNGSIITLDHHQGRRNDFKSVWARPEKADEFFFLDFKFFQHLYLIQVGGSPPTCPTSVVTSQKKKKKRKKWVGQAHTVEKVGGPLAHNGSAASDHHNIETTLHTLCYSQCVSMCRVVLWWCSTLTRKTGLKLGGCSPGMGHSLELFL